MHGSRGIAPCGVEGEEPSFSQSNYATSLTICAFAEFGSLQKALEDRHITPSSAELEYVPGTPVELVEAAAQDVLKLIDKLEEDDDVQKVYHNLG